MMIKNLSEKKKKAAPQKSFPGNLPMKVEPKIELCQKVMQSKRFAKWIKRYLGPKQHDCTMYQVSQQFLCLCGDFYYAAHLNQCFVARWE